MMKVKCDCGKIMYVGISKCPACGRRITEKNLTVEDFPKPVEQRGEPCPTCGVGPEYDKSQPGITYPHKAGCGVGEMTRGQIRTAGTGGQVQTRLRYVCSIDFGHTADKEGPCPFCWAVAVALKKEPEK